MSCKSNFKVGDKIRILNVHAIQFGERFWRNGDIVRVTEVCHHRGIHAEITLQRELDPSDTTFIITSDEFHAIELADDAPTKKQRLKSAEQRITSLEGELAELKAKQGDIDRIIKLADEWSRLSKELT